MGLVDRVLVFLEEKDIIKPKIRCEASRLFEENGGLYAEIRRYSKRTGKPIYSPYLVRVSL